MHADSTGENTSDEILKLNTIDKILLKCDVIDGRLVNGLRHPILYSVVLDKPGGFRVFCPLKTVHSKKTCFEYYNILFGR